MKPRSMKDSTQFVCFKWLLTPSKVLPLQFKRYQFHVYNDEIGLDLFFKLESTNCLFSKLNFVKRSYAAKETHAPSFLQVIRKII